MENIANLQETPRVISIGHTDIGPYYWVGQCPDGVEYRAGQTFVAPTSGRLKTIRLFPSMVYGDTNATLSVYEFDQHTHTWRDKKAEVNTRVSKDMEGNWISFDLSGLPVSEGNSYAFKIACNNGGMLAIAECPWNIQNPYAPGEQWIGSSLAEEGRFHKDFDLAFEAQIEA